MIKEISVLCSTLTFGSCSATGAPWKVSGTDGTRMLDGFTVIRGGHCESSAVLNALRFEGYDVSECMITGGGGALSFIFLKGDFPFVGARNDDMRAVFFRAARIGWHDEIPSGKDAGWIDIDSILARKIPVVLRVDMRFLPYRYNGKYGPAYASFGAHYITLFGIDRARDVALVSDTEFEGLQTVKLGDLHKARTSRTKNFPPRAEYYWAEPPASGSGRGSNGLAQLDPDLLVRSSFDAVLYNYENGALSALERYGADIASLEKYSSKTFLLPAVLEYMAGNIEDFGTGGASFRVLYCDFLLYAASKSSYKESSHLIPLIEDSISSWHGLSAEFRALAKRVRVMDRTHRDAELARIGKTADELFIREKLFYNEMKKINREE